MDALSPETLHRLERDDDSVTELKLGRVQNSISADHFSRLGAAIAKSSFLFRLDVDVYRCHELTESNIDFFEGIKQNSSIQRLWILCGSRNIVGTAAHEILKAYQHENNNVLAQLDIQHAGLQNGGDLAVAETLRCCTNLNYIKLSCDINDEHMVPLVEALRGNQTLDELNLQSNRIGNAGCNAIATLLEDPNNNLQYLSLSYNQIGDDGAIAIANSLVNNTKLTGLYLSNNSNVGQKAISAFSRVLCDTSSINSTNSSNHSLLCLSLSGLSGSQNQKLQSLLILNKAQTKAVFAIKKILQCHPDIDMEQLFEFDDEKGERSLKGLPYVINWFEKAKTVSGGVDRQRLSAIYQFALTMPLLFIPTEHTKGRDAKRKRARDCGDISC